MYAFEELDSYSYDHYDSSFDSDYDYENDFSKQDTNTPLHKAVLDNNIKAVLDLLANGADVNVKNDRERTPLHLLTESNFSSEDALEMAKILIDAGADINSADETEETPFTTATLNSDIPLIEYLLSRGADVNRGNWSNWTALHNSSTGSKPSYGAQITKLLLKNKADVNLQNDEGNTPLFLSLRWGALDVALILINHESTDVNIANVNEETPLHCAIKLKDKKFVKPLLKKGANINALDCRGRTALTWALVTQWWHAELENEKIRVLQYLLMKGADVNTIDNTGKNILNLKSDEKFQKIILEHVAKMEILNLPIHTNLLETISERENFSSYFTKCKEELLKVKNIKICDYNITLFDLLTNDKIKLQNYVKNEDLVSYCESMDLKKSFTIYGSSMQKNISKAVKRNQLYEEASKSLKNCLPIENAKDFVVENIIKFFEKLDLEKLCA